jgi:hypothetical protein
VTSHSSIRRRPIRALFAAATLVVAGLTVATTGSAAAAKPAAHTVAPKAVNNLDCNGWSKKYTSIRRGMKATCVDPVQRKNGEAYRFRDNGHYVGHDEPSVKFISHAPGSANTFSYVVQLPVDPVKAPTASGSVTKYGELSVAPWFGLPLCDPKSYPLNACKPDSDSNTGNGKPTDAGSAFMELQFYAPGFAPFEDNLSCSPTQWCSALNIDSLESTFNFAFLNPNCTEPINFAFLQRNGVPPGPPSPQLSDLDTFTTNAQTLTMNPGDVLQVSISDPATGFTTRIHDVTTGQTGFMVASAHNGFMNTNVKTCAGTPHTFHAEYNTAAQQHEVPWAALEGGVLMQQEIGHSEICHSVTHQLPFSSVDANGESFVDRAAFQTCNGGSEGPGNTGEGPCNPKTGICQNASTEGTTGPIACPTKNSASGQNCEFSDYICHPKGNHRTIVNGVAKLENEPVAMCLDNGFQNGDLDFDGASYQQHTWPDGTTNHPTPFRYVGPFGPDGHPYPQVQFETNVPASEFLCNTSNGHNCDVKPLGSKFYPFWSLNNSQRTAGAPTPSGTCVWNFGHAIAGLTTKTFGGDAEYGSPDLAFFGGTSISPVMKNPEFSNGCPSFNLG